VQCEQGECECGGWLFSQYPRKASSDRIEIAWATGAGDNTRASSRQSSWATPSMPRRGQSSGSRPSPARRRWHCHTIPGSELPSLQDARAWAGTMDRLGRTAYVSIVVSPSEKQGWLFPRFSAWVAGRDYTRGVPSRPIVGRARMKWD